MRQLLSVCQILAMVSTDDGPQSAVDGGRADCGQFGTKIVPLRLLIKNGLKRLKIIKNYGKTSDFTEKEERRLVY
jgi:hypothetical protein